MIKYSNIAIIASFFALWMDSFLTFQLQILTGFFLIFSVGILHGANDLILIRVTDSKKELHSTLKVFASYFLVVLAGIGFFYFLPQLALLLFILVSGYHFGEQEWQVLSKHFPKTITSLFYILHGLLVLLLLFTIHAKAVEEVIFNITQNTTTHHYPFGLLLLGVGFMFIVLTGYCYWKVKKIRKRIYLEYFHFLIFAIIFKTSSLIWGFAIYFIFWHSIPSIIDQVKYINGSFSKSNFISYCKSAALYWLFSIIGIATLYVFFKDTYLFNALFFSFLAAITFPHVFVINSMFVKKKA